MKISEKNKDFFQMVFEVVKLIPEGKVTNYGAIAKYLGATRSSRMVGWAMNASHDQMDIPAHRVVNRVGLLTGASHFDYPGKMQELLEAEGLKIKNNQVVDFQKHFWDPNLEIKLP
ncbi:unnamed protein product [Chrysoparadoxa australica]